MKRAAVLGRWSLLSCFPSNKRPRRTSVNRGGAYNRRLACEYLEDRRLLAIAVGDLVWHDADSDGIQDAGEPGIAGAVVEIFSSPDGEVGNADDVSRGVAITDATGHYSLDNLTAATNYFLVFRTPVGYAFTLQDQGSDDAKDSDADATGVTAMFTLAPGQNRTDLDAGLVGGAPSFGFALRAGATNQDYGQSVAIDASGNIYVTGEFQGTADFDAGPGEYNLASAGGEDAFVAKYSPAGALVWARSMGGTNDEWSTGIAVAPDGSVYSAGCFAATADFDPGSGVHNLSSAGGNDIFVSKLDSAGNFVWARRMGGTMDEGAYGLALAADGNVYTTGWFAGAADFDPGTSTFNLTSAGGYDIFVSKLDSAGNFVWARRMGGTSDDIGYDVAAAADGSVYTTGVFRGTADFDPSAATFNLTSAANIDIFVSKLDSSGDFVWARGMGGTEQAYGIAIAVAGDGSVYTTGDFRGTADFDPGSGTFNLSSAGISDVFVSKLDSAGNFVWARGMGGTDNDIGQAIALAPDGSVYTTGYLRGTADFDPGTGTFNLTSGGASNIFVSRLDSGGNFVSARSMVGTGDDNGYGICVAPDGTVYTTGRFGGTTDFDPGSGAFNLTSAGGNDIFVAKLNIAPTVSGVYVAGGSQLVTQGERLIEDVPQVIVAFSENLSMAGGTSGANSVTNPANWGVTRNGSDVSSTISGVSFGLNGTTGRYEAVVALAAVLSPGQYVLTAKAAIQDLAGNALDGNADGSAGDDFSRAFSVATIAPAGSEFQVNTFTTGSQFIAAPAPRAVAMDADGNFVITWTSDGQDGSAWGVYAQRFNGAGVPQGDEFQVNSTTNGDQWFSSVAMDADGDFIITWADFSLDGSQEGVFAKRYNAAGVEQVPPEGVPRGVGNEFRVNSTTTGVQSRPAVAMDADGDFVVTWADGGQDGSLYGIYAQRYNRAGVPQGTEFRVNSTTLNHQQLPEIAMDADGDFVITWTSDDQDGSQTGVYAQRYNATGAPQGSEFQVNTYTIGDQRRSTVAMDADGNFVIAWEGEGQDGWGVDARQYNSAGNPKGAVFRVSALGGYPGLAEVAMDADGDFVVTYTLPWDVYARRYNAAGEAQGGEFRVNSSALNNQGPSSVAMDADGDFVIAWLDQYRGGDSDDCVYAQRYGVNNAPTATDLTQTKSYTEGAASVALDDIVVTDPDTGEVITATLTLADPAAGSLTANDGATYNATTGVWTISSNVAAVNTALAGVAFVPNTDNDRDTTISTLVRDASGTGPAAGTITLDVTGTNDAPIATNLTQTKSYTEGAANVALDDIVVTDPDTGDTITSTLTLADTTTGSLTANDGATYNAGVWTISGSLAAVNTALAGVAFVPATNNDRDTTISAVVRDAAGTGPAAGTITLNVTGTADAPTATDLTQTKSYTEGAASVALDDIVVTDPDTGEVITATLTLADPAAGSLTANDGATYNATTGVWTISSNVAAVNTALANVAFVPATDNDRDTTISTLIRDAADTGPAAGTITLDVTAVPDPPTATNLTQTKTYTEGAASVALDDIVVTDPDTGDVITATLTLADRTTGSLTPNNGASYNAGTGVWSISGSVSAVNTALAGVAFVPTTENDRATTINTLIRDAAGTGPAAGTITLDVTPVNDAPVLGAIGPKSVNEQAPLSFTATATDQDVPAQTLTYSLDAAAVALGMSINSTTGVFSWTPTEAQGGSSYPATITVTDNGANPANLTDSETITITVAEVNVAPVLGAIGPKSVNEQAPLSFTATATDQDVPAQTLTYSLDAAAVAQGMGINSTTGVFSWMPTEAQGGSSYPATITVTDNGTNPANLSDSETITITVNEVNVAPVLGAIGPKSVNEQATLSFTASAADQDVPAQTLTYSLDAAAVALGMGINSTTGVFSWTPTEAQGGSSYPATITVTDNGTNPANLTDSETITITVNEVNVDPVLGAIGSKSVNEQATLSFTATATDQDLPAQTLTYSLDAAAVALGMRIHPTTGVFTWTPTELQGGQSYQATITVTDNGANPANLTDDETFTITVNEANVAPVLESIGDKNVNEQAALSFTATATDQDQPAQTLTYSLNAAAVALGMSVNPTTGVFSWTPTESQGGQSYQTTITVTDNGTNPANLTDFETFTITVAEAIAAPVLAGIEATPLAYTENDPATAITATLTVNDADNAILAGATVQITGNYQNGQDVLSFTNQGGITGSWDAATGVLTLTGSASVAAYQTALRGVRYQNTSDSPSGAVRTVAFQASDGVADSNLVTREIVATPVNDAPVLDNTGEMWLDPIDQGDVANRGTLVRDLIASAEPPDRITDGDAGALEGIAVIGVNNANGRWQYSINNGGEWRDFGSPSEDQARLLAADAITRVRFVPNANYWGRVEPGIIFRAWDQTTGVNGGVGDTTASGGTTAFSIATETAAIDVDPVVRVADQPGNNKLTLRRSGDNLELILLRPGKKPQVLWRGAIAEVGKLTVYGARKHQNAMTVASVGIVPPRGLVFDSVNNLNADSVVVRGSADADLFEVRTNLILVGGSRPVRLSGVEKVTLDGGSGDDAYRIFGLPTNITLMDSRGTDTLDFNAATAGVRVDLSKSAGQAQQVFRAQTANTLALKGTFENVFGTHQADWIKGNAAANVIYGSSGDDAIYGGAGNDTLYGGPGDDWLYGDAGHDTLYGELGNNVLLGGTGNDLLDTDDGVVADLAGRNLLIGGAGVDTLRGGPGEEILIGGTTRYDSRPKSLAAVMAAWKSQELSFEDRCNKLDEGFQDTAGAGWVQLRRKDKKNAKGAVLDDAAADMFFGGAGKDWFLSFPSDDVRDRDPDAGDR